MVLLVAWQPTPVCARSLPAPAPPAAGAFGRDPATVGLGLPKGWEVKGRPPWCLPCLQPSCVVSRTALLTAASPVEKEAIAPKGSWQHLKTSSWPNALERPWGCQYHQCPKSSEAGTVRHHFREPSPGMGSNKNAGSAWPCGEASRISLN